MRRAATQGKHDMEQDEKVRRWSLDLKRASDGSATGQKGHSWRPSGQA